MRENYKEYLIRPVVKMIIYYRARCEGNSAAKFVCMYFRIVPKLLVFKCIAGALFRVLYTPLFLPRRQIFLGFAGYDFLNINDKHRSEKCDIIRHLKFKLYLFNGGRKV